MDPAFLARVRAHGAGAPSALSHPSPPTTAPRAASAGAPVGGSASTPIKPKQKRLQRQYPLVALLDGARLCLRKRRAGCAMSAQAAAGQLGYPSMRSMLGKLLRLVAIKEGEAAQDAFVASYEFPKQGNKDFEARRLFSSG